MTTAIIEHRRKAVSELICIDAMSEYMLFAETHELCDLDPLDEAPPFWAYNICVALAVNALRIGNPDQYAKYCEWCGGEQQLLMCAMMFEPSQLFVEEVRIAFRGETK